MNDNLKKSTQEESILKYSNEIKEFIEKLYNDFSINKDVDIFKRSMENYMDILNNIQNDILLDTDQKDSLFQKYYNLCIDKSDDVDDAEKKTDIRKIIFNHLKDKKLFNDTSLASEIINVKFKKEVDDLNKKYEEAIKRNLLKQKLEQQQALQMEKQLNEIQQRKQLEQQQALKALNSQGSDVYQGQNTGKKFNQDDFHCYKQISDIITNTTNKSIDNAYGLLQKSQGAYVYQGQNTGKKFNQDDFYRYKQINDLITNQTNETIDGAYRFVQNEIKNSQMNAKKTKNDNIVNNEFNNNNQVDANLLMQQLLNLKAKTTTQKAYDKKDKNIQNSTTQNEEKIIDKNALNPNLSKE